MSTVCKRNGDKEDVDEKKLYASIYHPAKEARYSDDAAAELAETVTQAVMDWAVNEEDGVVTKNSFSQAVFRCSTVASSR